MPADKLVNDLNGRCAILPAATRKATATLESSQANSARSCALQALSLAAALRR
jgi:hypothetical protein